MCCEAAAREAKVKWYQSVTSATTMTGISQMNWIGLGSIISGSRVLRFRVPWKV
jgi:hypothetical protein